MEGYLLYVKILADSLATIQSPVSDLELIQYTTSSLPPDYHTFVTTYSMMPGSYTFDDLHSKLIFYEQWLKFQSNRETTVHQALVSTVSSVVTTKGVVLAITTIKRKIMVVDVSGTTRVVVTTIRVVTGTTPTPVIRIIHPPGVCLLIS